MASSQHRAPVFREDGLSSSPALLVSSLTDTVSREEQEIASHQRMLVIEQEILQALRRSPDLARVVDLPRKARNADNHPPWWESPVRTTCGYALRPSKIKSSPQRQYHQQIRRRGCRCPEDHLDYPRALPLSPLPADDGSAAVAASATAAASRSGDTSLNDCIAGSHGQMRGSSLISPVKRPATSRPTTHGWSWERKRGVLGGGGCTPTARGSPIVPKLNYARKRPSGGTSRPETALAGLFTPPQQDEAYPLRLAASESPTMDGLSPAGALLQAIREQERATPPLVAEFRRCHLAPSPVTVRSGSRQLSPTSSLRSVSPWRPDEGAAPHSSRIFPWDNVAGNSVQQQPAYFNAQETGSGTDQESTYTANLSSTRTFHVDTEDS